MKVRLGILCGILLLCSCARSQDRYKLVGGPCEGCEAVFEYGSRELKAVDTLPDFQGANKKLKISGTIFLPDGKTPAENVVLYIHHTNAKGVYPTKGAEAGWKKRHGYLRGWIKTGKDGRYTFYTQVPESYPDGTEPAHIHPFILEPDGKYYYLSAFFFKDDPLLTSVHRQDTPRGGNGIVELQERANMLYIERDIILGKGVPGYE